MTQDRLEPNHFLQSLSTLFPSGDSCNPETAAIKQHSDLISQAILTLLFFLSGWRKEKIPCKAAMVHYFQVSADEGTNQAALFTGGKERAKMEGRCKK